MKYKHAFTVASLILVLLLSSSCSGYAERVVAEAAPETLATPARLPMPSPTSTDIPTPSAAFPSSPLLTPAPTSTPTPAPTSTPTPAPTPLQTNTPTPTSAPVVAGTTDAQGITWYDGTADPSTIQPQTAADALSVNVLVNKYWQLPDGFVPPLVEAASSSQQ